MKTGSVKKRGGGTPGRAKFWLLLIVALTPGAFFLGAGVVGRVAPEAKVVEAERFVVRDSGGTVRAHFGVDVDGAVGIQLLSGDGTPRASLVLLEGGPDLSLYDNAGRRRASIRLPDRGGPHLRFADAEEETRALFGAVTLASRETGEEFSFPESSFMLFGDDGEVISSTAPRLLEGNTPERGSCRQAPRFGARLAARPAVVPRGWMLRMASEKRGCRSQAEAYPLETRAGE